MATTLAHQYFLKAQDAFPFEMAEVLENLQYALSYDEECIGALCLMGKVQQEYLHYYESAERYLQQALAIEAGNSCALQQLFCLYVKWPRLQKAERLLSYAQRQAVFSPSYLYTAQGALLERRGFIKLARNYLQMAQVHALNDEEQALLNREAERLKKQHKAQRKLQKRGIIA